MKRRNITPALLAALKDTPVVYLQGARQTGKSTLAKGLVAEGYEAAYLTLDDAGTLAAARSDPDGFVDALPERVVLDEVQRVPELFRAIKRSVDAARRPGRFLLTGSARVLHSPTTSESLAGRLELLTLWPLSQGEIESRRETFVDACFARTFKPAQQAASMPWPSLAARIVAGGYPEVAARREAQRRQAWFGSYLTAMLERDVRDLANIAGLRELPRLLRLAASRTTGLLNFAGLSRDAGIPQTTLQRYWALLEATFLVRTVPPWHANLGLRLVKTPKLLLSDTGLLCHLLGLDAKRLETDELMAGAVVECFVANELTRQLTWSGTDAHLFHYRTHTQQKVDLVLEDARGRLVGIEVKRTASPSTKDFKGLSHLSDQAGDRFLRGIVLHTGRQGVAFGRNLYAVPIASLWAPAEGAKT